MTKAAAAHPPGLRTLFFTELWERLSYYGMRALLVLFLVSPVSQGGYGLSDARATAIYGLYTASVYLSGLPGGWIADRILGQRQAVFAGGVIIALGHFSMAIGPPFTFYLGLVLIVIGTGLLKPNVSAMVGDLYPEGGPRRDAGFSIYYMGINIGALVGPLLCGYLGEKVNWHFGFAAAGIGMVFGLIQYRLGWNALGDAGLLQADSVAGKASAKKTLWMAIAGVAALTGLLVLLDSSGVLELAPDRFANSLGVVIPLLAAAYFTYLFLFGGFTSIEKKRLVVVLVLFIASASFWAGYEQGGSSLNLFGERLTDRMMFGFEAPTSWLQSINPLFIICLAPVAGWLWLRLGDKEPSLPAKFAFGLIQLGAGFLVLAWASTYTVNGNKVSPGWLTLTYLLHTMGELCLSPVGLSSMTKLAPRRLVGQMMGIWFMAAAFGNLIAGLLAGRMESLGLVQLFSSVAIATIVIGLLLLSIAGPVKRLMGGVK